MYTAGMDKVQKSEFEAIASSLEESTDYEKNYILMTQISGFLDKKDDPELLTVFLTGYVDNHPRDDRDIIPGICGTFFYSSFFTAQKQINIYNPLSQFLPE